MIVGVRLCEKWVGDSTSWVKEKISEIIRTLSRSGEGARKLTLKSPTKIRSCGKEGEREGRTERVLISKIYI